MTKIYLIRHAEAEGNIYRVAHGQYNSIITPRGYRQLAYLRDRFADIHIDAVCGSDLFRTYTTASAIFVPKNLPFHPIPALREVRMGIWETLSWSEIERLDSEMLYYFNKRPDLWRVEGAETFEVVRDRMLSGIRQIAEEYPNQTVAATSHGAAIRILVGTLLGMSLWDIGENMRHYNNTSVTLLEVEGDEIRVVFAGDDSHLPDEISIFRQQTWHQSDKATEPGLWYEVIEQDDTGRTQRAMLENEEAGEVAVCVENHNLRISHYEIKEELRGKRYGVQLLGQVVQYARERAMERIVVAPVEGNEGFFLKQGFVPTENGDLSLDIRLMLRPIPEKA